MRATRRRSMRSRAESGADAHIDKHNHIVMGTDSDKERSASQGETYALMSHVGPDNGA